VQLQFKKVCNKTPPIYISWIEGCLLMLVQIFYAIMYIFALYGFISIALTIVRRFYHNIRLKNANIRLVLIAKDQEEIIEGVIRSIFQGGILESLTQDNTLYIVDMGSTDRTADILQRLKETYQNMEALTIENKEQIFYDFI
jgi:hypothetical protein